MDATSPALMVWEWKIYRSKLAVSEKNMVCVGGLVTLILKTLFFVSTP